MRRAVASAVLVASLLIAGCRSGAPPVASPSPAPPPAATSSPVGSPVGTPEGTPSPAPTLSLAPSRSATPGSAPSPAAAPGAEAGLRAAFAELAASERGQLSIAVAPVGGSAAPMVFGDLGAPVAWSSSKVPLAIAVERTPQGAGLRSTMRRAITASDNDAAIQLWQSLGQPSAAAAATDRVLRDFGDPVTKTQSRQVRPPYTAFGQTTWTLVDQTRFAAHLPCRAEAAPVYAAMGQVIPDQSWGLGRLPSAHFKGGWGPSTNGYLVRQFGVIDTPRGQVAVAMAVEAPGFEQGTATLSRAAQWLGTHVGDLPAGGC